MRGLLRGLAFAIGVSSLVTAGPVLPAAAEPGVPGPRPVENIPAYDVVLTIEADAVLHVRETITYDFHRGGEHGIVRPVPYRRGDRLYEVRNVRSGSSTGAPARARTLRMLNDVRITVGDQGRRVTGRQAYVIEYEMAGLFTPHADRDELSWDAIGSAWDVPIGEAAVRVEAPIPLRKASCTAGTPRAATRCLRDRDGPYAIDFTQRGLRPREGVFVRVRLPKGAVKVPPPEYARPHWTGTWAGTATLGMALAAVAVVGTRRTARGRPLPRPGAGRALVAAGALAVLADLADDVVPRGPWAFSLGDLCVAGLGLVIAGAGLEYAHRTRPREGPAIVPEEDYS